MTVGPTCGGEDEIPQAIAGDYPGWGSSMKTASGRAWCPAVAVHAASAAALRAAIERAITGEDEP